MKIKERIKNVGFWVSIISAVFLILGAFGVEIGDETVSSVINAVCSLLVVTGIVSDPTTGKGYLDAMGKGLDTIPSAALAEVATAIGGETQNTVTDGAATADGEKISADNSKDANTNPKS